VIEANAAAVTATGSAERFAEAHRRLLADGAIQLEMAPFKEPVPPAWVEAVIEFLKLIFPLLRILVWAAVAAAAIFLVWAIVRRLRDGEWSWLRRRGPEAEAEAWRPEEAPARALLREADALAAAGRYGEAAHLLLFRSIEDIDRRRPRLVRPALTSRDIAGAPALPSGPRRSFGDIVMMVERSLFGGRTLEQQDWQACRSAYEDFAFASAWKD
jgi:hypothetical protein